MRIATFNVNGIRARLPRLLDWLREAQPDAACLQEIKIVDADFPRLEFEALGYRIETCGQKGFNGVALLSKLPAEEVLRQLPGDPSDEQARYIEAMIGGIRIGCLYLPNGNPRPGPKFDYKLAWMDRLISRAKDLLRREAPTVLAGDFNICPADEDVYDPEGWREDALCHPDGRARFRALLNLGYTDALRLFQPSGHAFTFWDYQAGAWQRDNGLRIDHFLLNAQAADRVESCRVDRKPRAQEIPSDHTPVILTLKD